MTDNPYAPPTQIAPLTMTMNPTQDCYRYENMLAVRDGTVLPHVCPKTNQATGSDDWRKQLKITWTPQWVFLLILINVLVVLIVALCVRKRGNITYSMSKTARKKVAISRISGFSLLALAIVSGSTGFILDNEDYMIAGVLIAILLLLISLFAFSAHGMLRPQKFKDGWFLIKGCDPGFLARFPDAASAGLSF
jgi:hypothetical protein